MSSDRKFIGRNDVTLSELKGEEVVLSQRPPTTRSGQTRRPVESQASQAILQPSEEETSTTYGNDGAAPTGAPQALDQAEGTHLKIQDLSLASSRLDQPIADPSGLDDEDRGLTESSGTAVEHGTPTKGRQAEHGNADAEAQDSDLEQRERQKNANVTTDGRNEMESQLPKSVEEGTEPQELCAQTERDIANTQTSMGGTRSSSRKPVHTEAMREHMAELEQQKARNGRMVAKPKPSDEERAQEEQRRQEEAEITAQATICRSASQSALQAGHASTEVVNQWEQGLQQEREGAGVLIATHRVEVHEGQDSDSESSFHSADDTTVNLPPQGGKPLEFFTQARFEEITGRKRSEAEPQQQRQRRSGHGVKPQVTRSAHGSRSGSDSERSVTARGALVTTSSKRREKLRAKAQRASGSGSEGAGSTGRAQQRASPADRQHEYHSGNDGASGGHGQQHGGERQDRSRMPGPETQLQVANCDTPSEDSSGSDGSRDSGSDSGSASVSELSVGGTSVTSDTALTPRERRMRQAKTRKQNARRRAAFRTPCGQLAMDTLTQPEPLALQRLEQQSSRGRSPPDMVTGDGSEMSTTTREIDMPEEGVPVRSQQTRHVARDNQPYQEFSTPAGHYQYQASVASARQAEAERKRKAQHDLRCRDLLSEGFDATALGRDPREMLPDGGVYEYDQRIHMAVEEPHQKWMDLLNRPVITAEASNMLLDRVRWRGFSQLEPPTAWDERMAQRFLDASWVKVEMAMDEERHLYASEQRTRDQDLEDAVRADPFQRKKLTKGAKVETKAAAARHEKELAKLFWPEYLRGILNAVMVASEQAIPAHWRAVNNLRPGQVGHFAPRHQQWFEEDIQWAQRGERRAEPPEARYHRRRRTLWQTKQFHLANSDEGAELLQRMGVAEARMARLLETVRHDSSRKADARVQAELLEVRGQIMDDRARYTVHEQKLEECDRQIDQLLRAEERRITDGQIKDQRRRAMFREGTRTEE